MRALNIVETAYRATLEEQDDTIVWLSHAMLGAGAELGVMLRGNAVNYAVRAQDPSGLAFGDLRQTQPPELAEDLAKLIAKQTQVYIVEEDLAERGIAVDELVPGLTPIASGRVAALMDDFDQVWHW